jgi:hypothetical protein
VVDERKEAFAVIITFAEEHGEDHVPLFFGCRGRLSCVISVLPFERWQLRTTGTRPYRPRIPTRICHRPLRGTETAASAAGVIPVDLARLLLKGQRFPALSRSLAGGRLRKYSLRANLDS